MIVLVVVFAVEVAVMFVLPHLVPSFLGEAGKAVMDAVHNLTSRKTIILIAHRLSTVKKCDQIFLLEHGQLVAQGTYSELLEMSLEFRKMAAVNE